MRKITSLLLPLSLWLLWPAAAIAEIFGVTISPDGKTYAVLEEVKGKRVVGFFSVDNAEAKPGVVLLGEVETDGFAWSNSALALVRLTNLERETDTVSGLQTLSFSRWASIDAKSGDIEMLFDNVSGNDFNYYIEHSGELLATLPGDARALFSRISVRESLGSPTLMKTGTDSLVYGLHTANTSSGKVRRKEWGQPETSYWLVDETGTAIGRVDENSEASEWRYYRHEGKRATLVKSLNLEDGDIRELELLGRDHEDGYAIGYIKNAAGDTRYMKMNMATGAIEELDLSELNLSGMTYITYDPRRARAHAIVQDDGQLVYHLNPKDRALQKTLSKTLPGATILIESASMNRMRFIIKASYADKPNERYLYDRAAKRFELIALG